MTDAVEAQWRTELSGQLAVLQTRMAGLEAVLMEGRK